ncbi:GGDEF domain-containing protein [Alicyclobacillus sp. ALC3]|uniref:GGDEF domain-containing protein n=1 Tax=Alicyclobacillus sp. ALC3 TaxID=2796143 RepID=UPI0023780C04|nr:GGDEF domain-containing protein [Alicyclobacillus sp. ALC3]WDL95767.1 GGDEF domain-containing protein [Alicyclobacillus sp. ALC3]
MVSEQSDEAIPVSADAIQIQMQIMAGLVTGMPLDDVLKLVLRGMSARMSDCDVAVWVEERVATELRLVFRAEVRMAMGGAVRERAEQSTVVPVEDGLSDSVLAQLRAHFGDPASVHVEWIVIYDTKNRSVGVVGIHPHEQRALTRLELQFTRQYVLVAGLAIEKEQLDRENFRLAHFDYLTDIPNRRLFEERLINGINQSLESRQPLSLVLIDVDNFKLINDTYGHAAGDRVLQMVARTALSRMRDADTVARIGGDEFAFVLTNTTAPCALEFINEILEAVNRPMTWQGQVIRVLASAGIVDCPAHGSTPDELLHCADVSLYAAKRSDTVRAKLYTA